MPSRRKLLAVAASMLLAGCSTGDESASEAPSTDTPTDVPTTAASTTGTASPTPPSLNVDADDLDVNNRTDESRSLTLERRVDGETVGSRSWTVAGGDSVTVESVPLLHEQGEVVCSVPGYDPVPAEYAGGDAMLVIDIGPEEIRTSSLIA